MTLVSELSPKPLDRHKAAELSRDLHQVAQPLTVLQGFLELALTKPHTAEEYKHSIERALDESRRVSACFDRIRELVRTSPPVRPRDETEPSRKYSKGPHVAHPKKTGCLHV